MNQSPPPKARLAVIGCGAVTAIHHLPAIVASRGAEAVLLVDSDRGRAEELAKRFGVPAVATDYREVPGQAEGAIVAVPNHLHAPVSIDLLSRGVHVLVEKPMALTVAETDAMMEAARTWGSILGVGLEFRFFDGSRWVKELLADGLLGPIRRFDLRQGVIPSWPFATDFLLRKEMAGGGVVADLGVHVLDLLLWWLGDWESVEYRDDAAGGLESDAELRLVLRSGATGTVEVSRTRSLRNTCLLEGVRGTLEVGIWDPDPVLRLHLRRPGGTLFPFERDEVVFEGWARGRKGGAFDMRAAFRRQVDDFAGAIREKRETFVPGVEGRRTLTLIEACYARRTPWELPWRIDPLEAERRADAPGIQDPGLSAGASNSSIVPGAPAGGSR